MIESSVWFKKLLREMFLVARLFTAPFGHLEKNAVQHFRLVHIREFRPLHCI